jgi:hypothetical protein
MILFTLAIQTAFVGCTIAPNCEPQLAISTLFGTGEVLGSLRF